VLGEVAPSFYDQWPRLRPSDRGATFDGGSNACCHDTMEVMRYDRVLLHAEAPPPPHAVARALDWAKAKLGGVAAATPAHSPYPLWAGRHISMIGTSSMDHPSTKPLQLKPSDHYGLEFHCSPQLPNQSAHSAAAASEGVPPQVASTAHEQLSGGRRNPREK